MNPISNLARLRGPRTWRAPRPLTTRLALPADRLDSGLQFSEILLLAVLFFASFLSISYPLFGFHLHHSFLNHSALFLFAPVFVLHYLGQLLNQRVAPGMQIMAVCWPLICLAWSALVGSSFAKWDAGLDDTYLTFGIYLLLLPVYAASMPVQADRVRAWSLMLILIWILASTAALVGEATRFGTPGSLHEIEYVVATGFFAMYYAVRSLSLKFLALLMLVAAAVLNAKLTGYIVLTLALLHVVITVGWRRLPANWRTLYGAGALAFAVAVSCVLAVLYFEFREFLPSGNPDVRLAQYETAWREFLASPVWGNAYLKGSGETFNAGYGRLYIPTHSDVLDILKHGGLIGFVLFAWGYCKVFALIHAAVKATVGQRLVNAYFMSLRFFQVTALATFMLNPLLLKGPFLVVIWGNLGFGIGLALAMRNRTTQAAPP